MEIVKKNLVSIIFGVIVLIAIALLFWPISGWYEDLQKQAAARAGVHTELQNMLNKERMLPVVSLEEGAPPQKLEQFPTESIIKRGSEIKDRLAEEASKFQSAAVAMNQGDKKLLVPNTLPQPRNVSEAYAFQRAYIESMADYMNPDPAKRGRTIPFQMLRAGMKPTERDILEAQQNQERRIRANETITNEKGVATNADHVNRRVAEEKAKVPTQLQAAVATSNAIYLDPNALTVMDGRAAANQGGSNVQFDVTRAGVAPQPDAIFWAQMTLWLQQDVFKALAEMNGQSQSVLDSPVKRLMRLNAPPQFVRAAAVQNTGEDDGSGLAPPPADPSMPIEKNFMISPTGRYSNPLYDVMHFDLSLVVEADRIPLVLQMLSKNRFMTCFETQVRALDSGAAQAEGYIYGDRPVVQLDMRCEAVFMRGWTLQYMPIGIKRVYGITDPPPAVPAEQ